MGSKKTINFSVLVESEGLRIESYLRDIFPDLSRAKWRGALEREEVRLNGKIARAADKVSSRDEIELLYPKDFQPGLRECLKQAFILPKVIYEDEFLFAFNKPREMHSVLQREDDPLTLADCAVVYCPQALEASPKRLDGGLVQRLDYYTDGICIVAKENRVWNALHEQFLSHDVLKTYQALLDGEMSKAVLKKAVAEEMFSGAEVLDVKKGASLVKVSLKSGARHIVRKSFKSLGFPLLGDETYGSGPRPNKEGFFLRCVKVELTHPFTNKRLELEIKVEEGLSEWLSSH